MNKNNINLELIEYLKQALYHLENTSQGICARNKFKKGKPLNQYQTNLITHISSAREAIRMAELFG